MKVLVLNGPNINMLGIREKNIYGTESYVNLEKMITNYCDREGVEVKLKQSNIEGELVGFIQQAYFDKVDGIVINPAAYTHTSIAILDALKAVNIPTVEVHISDISQREEFRQHSYVSLYAEHRIVGQGLKGYLEAIKYLKDKYGNKN